MGYLKLTEQDSQQQKILLLGVGNSILGDEGVGVHVVNKMREEGLPENVEAVDGGTLGLSLLDLLEGVSKLVIVDCLNAGAEPGDIFRFQPDDITVNQKVDLSFHDLGLLEVLTMAKVLGTLPETVIFGVQPDKLDWKIGLSEKIEAKLPTLIDLVKKELVN